MAPPPELPEEVVDEILLRLPPEEPTDLLRASLVCKRWCRLFSDPVFRRRYCRYHRTPPLLGFLHDMYEADHCPRFVSTVASPCSPPVLVCRSWWALDSRHGRILLHSFAPTDLLVWDPLTREQQRVPLPPYRHTFYTGAVLCAVGGCEHMDCHGGPFLVVFVGSNEDDGCIWVSVYSSETGSWGASSTIELALAVETLPGLLIGDALYFMIDLNRSILVYDLAGRGLSVIDVPDKKYKDIRSVVMLEGLGFVGVEDRSLYLWSRQGPGADGTAGWEQCGIIDLATLLPLPGTSAYVAVAGFVEGTDTIFLSTDVGIFTLKIKSRQVKRVGESGQCSAIIPYTGFYLPMV
ncbi:hypothetical protein EJB05_15396, partial [Eragrostis curvula]